MCLRLQSLIKKMIRYRRPVGHVRSRLRGKIHKFEDYILLTCGSDVLKQNDQPVRLNNVSLVNETCQDG